jgi:hypothetical protein
LQGKNRTRRNLHGNEEEGKKEETLIVAKHTSHGPRISTSLSREAPLERRFLFWSAPFKTWELAAGNWPNDFKILHASLNCVSQYSARQPRTGAKEEHESQDEERSEE